MTVPSRNRHVSASSSTVDGTYRSMPDSTYADSCANDRLSDERADDDLPVRRPRPVSTCPTTPSEIRRARRVRLRVAVPAVHVAIDPEVDLEVFAA
jgi:hypothetical protein